MGSLGVLALWALAGFVIMRFVVNINGPGELPTAAFLASGSGRILDMGAGTGRSTLMVLEGRPKTTVVAIDSFAESYDRHFGKGVTGLIAENLRAADMDGRAEVRTADMRELPFGAGEFDGIISVAAIDHLSSTGIQKALGEAARVCKPGGEFLLMVVNNDVYGKLAFGPLLAHGGTRPAARWVSWLGEAGFDVTERGEKPIMSYFLARRR